MSWVRFPSPAPETSRASWSAQVRRANLSQKGRKSWKPRSSHIRPPSPLRALRSGALSGRVRPPGDKSVSHRSLILGLLCVGETTIEGLLEGEDVLHTAQACRQLGARVTRHGDGSWSVFGAGLGSLLQPRETLDFGNAGTGSRLMMGVVGGHPITARIDGDASLRKRPMRRILEPLALQGARVLEQAEGGRCPIVLQGASEPFPIEYKTPVASAQIKSAVLLAGTQFARPHRGDRERSLARSHRKNAAAFWRGAHQRELRRARP